MVDVRFDIWMCEVAHLPPRRILEARGAFRHGGAGLPVGQHAGRRGLFSNRRNGSGCSSAA